MPYRVTTLIYCFDSHDRTLLLQRRKAPNQGLWSPCGGKLDTNLGESPHHCALRECREELGIETAISNYRLTGIVSERETNGEDHWLMFLFELLPRIDRTPAPIDEGEFAFFEARRIPELPLPRTDREQIWPLFWRHRGGFFVAHCETSVEGERWTVEQSQPKRNFTSH